MPITNNSETRGCGIAPGSAALPFPLLALPLTLTGADPIVGVGTPPAVAKFCAFAASAAKPTDAGLARKTV